MIDCLTALKNDTLARIIADLSVIEGTPAAYPTISKDISDAENVLFDRIGANLASGLINSATVR